MMAKVWRRLREGNEREEVFMSAQVLLAPFSPSSVSLPLP